MAVWRLIAHHADAESQLRAFRDLRYIAIGWSLIGDLGRIQPRSAAAITQMVRDRYPTEDNAHLGGPSLWRFYDEMQLADLVIVSDGNRRRAVMQVTGKYEFAPIAEAAQLGGYQHRRAADPVEADPDELWQKCGASVAAGENIRWTLARCADARIAPATSDDMDSAVSSA
jgi:predicted Mrr-cat superfamily restriction endonuclease